MDPAPQTTTTGASATSPISVTVTAGARSWIRSMLSEENGQWSAKRILFAVAVASSLLFCAVDIALNRSLPSNAVQLATMVITSTAGAYVGGRWAETKEGQSGSDQ